jgi:hypothetical protein
VADVVARGNDSNIKRVANLFGAAIAHNNWHAPKDAAAFTDFIHNQMAPHKLEMMGIKADDIDGIFVSERDGKPFKFRYGLNVPPMSTVPVVFEEQGIAGTKQVAYNNGKVEEVGELRYQQLWGDRGTDSASASPPQGNAASSTSQQPAVR